MNKDNVFRSSPFHMDEGDILHLLFLDETGTAMTVELFGSDDPDTPEVIADPTAVDYDGNYYTSVIIGTQEWLVENFRCEHYIDGTPIPIITLDAAWAADTIGAMCYYNNDEATYKPDYGALYNWYAVGNIHVLGITGWRIPNNSDWNILIAYLGGSSVAGGKLKEVGLVHWDMPNTGATDAYGFNSRGSGYRDWLSGTFNANKTLGKFWSSTDAREVTTAYNNAVGQLRTGTVSPKYGYSVRLMRDVT